MDDGGGRGRGGRGEQVGVFGVRDKDESADVTVISEMRDRASLRI
jgi:hypothetical protein